VRETRHHVAAEVALHEQQTAVAPLTERQIFWRTTLLDRNLSSVTQAGLVNNLNDGMAWGLFPLFFAAAGMNLGQIGTVRDLPGHVGQHPAPHRRLVGSRRPQVADRIGDVGSGGGNRGDHRV